MGCMTTAAAVVKGATTCAAERSRHDRSSVVEGRPYDDDNGSSHRTTIPLTPPMTKGVPLLLRQLVIMWMLRRCFYGAGAGDAAAEHR